MCNHVQTCAITKRSIGRAKTPRSMLKARIGRSRCLCRSHSAPIRARSGSSNGSPTRGQASRAYSSKLAQGGMERLRFVTGHQVALKGHQWPSGGTQRPSVAINVPGRRAHEPRDRVNGHQWSSVVISGHQRTREARPRASRQSQRSSVVISDHQWPSTYLEHGGMAPTLPLEGNRRPSVRAPSPRSSCSRHSSTARYRCARMRPAVSSRGE